MESTVFSIIIPAYNIAGYIEKCVKSVCPLESYEEVIIVDDGSTDETGEICDRLARSDEKIRVIHKKNGGLSSARNKGLEAACGKYVIFIDGDDYIDRNVLASIKDRIDSEPDVVFCDAVKVWENGRRKPMGDGVTGEIDDLRGAELFRYLSQLNKFPAAAWGKAFRRVFLLENALTFREGILSEDIEWSLRLYPKVDRAVYCDDVMYYYRQDRTGSITFSRGARHAMDILNTVEEYSAGLSRMKADGAQDDRGNALIELYGSFLEYELRVLLLKRNDVKPADAYDFRKRLKNLKKLTGYRKDIKSRVVAVLYRVLI